MANFREFVENKLTVAQRKALSGQVGISDAHLSKVINNPSLMTIHIARKLCEILEVDGKSLLKTDTQFNSLSEESKYFISLIP